MGETRGRLFGPRPVGRPPVGRPGVLDEEDLAPAVTAQAGLGARGGPATPVVVVLGPSIRLFEAGRRRTRGSKGTESG